jgi:hypothetical protein
MNVPQTMVAIAPIVASAMAMLSVFAENVVCVATARKLILHAPTSLEPRFAMNALLNRVFTAPIASTVMTVANSV